MSEVAQSKTLLFSELPFACKYGRLDGRINNYTKTTGCASRYRFPCELLYVLWYFFSIFSFSILLNLRKVMDGYSTWRITFPRFFQLFPIQRIISSVLIKWIYFYSLPKWRKKVSNVCTNCSWICADCASKFQNFCLYDIFLKLTKPMKSAKQSRYWSSELITIIDANCNIVQKN